MTRSLSNLYKQYLVQNQSDNVRVIDPNTLLELRAAKLLERQREEEKRQALLAQSFEAGIVRTDTEYIEEIKEEELVDPVEAAKEEAERILSEARAQAELITQKAQADAIALCEEYKAQGYTEGASTKERELQELKERLETDFALQNQMLESEYIRKRDNMEAELVDVILEVFNKVFHIQFDSKKHILMHLINDAILNIEGDRNFRIKVADSNVLFLENHREDIIERVGHGIELEFIADSSMDGNECLIETDSGIFDCSLETQLENLIKDIKSLCS